MNHSPRSSSALPPIAVHHILLKSELLAQDVLHELSLGADFADLAAESPVVHLQANTALPVIIPWMIYPPAWLQRLANIKAKALMSARCKACMVFIFSSPQRYWKELC